MAPQQAGRRLREASARDGPPSGRRLAARSRGASVGACVARGAARLVLYTRSCVLTHLPSPRKSQLRPEFISLLGHFWVRWMQHAPDNAIGRSLGEFVGGSRWIGESVGDTDKASFGPPTCCPPPRIWGRTARRKATARSARTSSPPRAPHKRARTHSARDPPPLRTRDLTRSECGILMGIAINQRLRASRAHTRLTTLTVALCGPRFPQRRLRHGQ